MDREKRIAEARRLAAERAPELARIRAEEAAVRAKRLAALSPEELREEARAVSSSEDIEAMGPDKSPGEWATARIAIRAAVVGAARRQHTITYDEIRLVAYEATGMRLGYFMTGRMCAEQNRRCDGCLLSAIIVNSDTGRPGEGFEPFAAEQGFTEPLPTLQRRVFEHFSE